MSKTLDIQHVVFATKHRRQTIPMQNREHLYRLIWSILKKRGCVLYRINGMRDHVHMLINLHPSVSKSDIVKEVKSISSQWMKKSGLFPDFDGWGAGFFSESKDPSTRDVVINYIKGQEAHHAGIDFNQELQSLCRNAGVDMDERDMR